MTIPYLISAESGVFSSLLYLDFLFFPSFYFSYFGMFDVYLIHALLLEITPFLALLMPRYSYYVPISYRLRSLSLSSFLSFPHAFYTPLAGIWYPHSVANYFLEIFG